MNQSIHYKTSSASYDELLHHLWSCDKNHNPKLSERLDIPNYARKIFEKSVTFEAWSKDHLIGLIAAYLDNEEQGFITNVSVSEEYMKKGIAKTLIQHCINDAVCKRIGILSLEVSNKNNTAINLYTKFGFKNHSQNSPSVIMRLNVKEYSYHE